MSLIQRYVLLEVLRVFVLAIAATTLLMTVAVGMNEGLKRGLPLTLSVQILPCVIPESLRMTVPASLLFGVCTVCGRMAAEGEFTAVKSLGIHPFRIYFPILLLAFLVSFGTYVTYEICASWARPSLKRTLIAAIDDIAYGTLQAERILKTKDVTISVKDVDERRLIQPRLEIVTGNGSQVFVEAAEATLEEIGESGEIRVTCSDMEFSNQPVEGTFPGQFRYDFRLERPVNLDPATLSPAELRANQLDGQIAAEREAIAQCSTALAQDPASEAAGRELANRQQRLYRLRAEGPRRMANGFAAFAFVMLGIPVATRSASKDNMSVFFLCMTPIALFYYPLLVAGEQLARSGVWPEALVWLAPLALTAAGVVMFQQLGKH